MHKEAETSVPPSALMKYIMRYIYLMYHIYIGHKQQIIPRYIEMKGFLLPRITAAGLQEQEEDGHIFIICCPDARTLTADLESIDFCAIKFLY